MFGQVRDEQTPMAIMSTRTYGDMAPSQVAPTQGQALIMQYPTGPACLTSEQAMVVMACMANPGTTGCQQMLRPEILGLPLCPNQPAPPLPECADQNLVTGLQYCNTYGSQGPDGALNSLCWLAVKYPPWYVALQKLPPCAGAPPPDAGPSDLGPLPNGLPEPDAYKPPDEDGNKKMLMWGGLILLLVAGGAGVYYYTKKKKPA